MKIERITSDCYVVKIGANNHAYTLVKVPNDTWQVSEAYPIKKIADDFLSLESALNYVESYL